MQQKRYLYIYIGFIYNSKFDLFLWTTPSKVKLICIRIRNRQLVFFLIIFLDIETGSSTKMRSAETYNIYVFPLVFITDFPALES
jgi:hypothetical protein